MAGAGATFLAWYRMVGIPTARELVDIGLSVVRACELTGVPRASYYRITRGYRHYKPVADRLAQRQRRQPAALSEPERRAIVEVLSAAENEDLSVSQVYWRALDAELVTCSQRTFYRVAGAAGLVGDRRRRRSGGGGHKSRRKPIVPADAPNDLWSWDVTELRGPGRQRYKLALAIDVFSRYPVCWCIEYGESREEIIAMFDEAFEVFDAPAGLHSDNGATMRSHDLLYFLGGMDVSPSFSRPRVSDDNPFSESFFKTIKYDLACPDRFDSIDHAREWTAGFLNRYATEHRHSGLGYYAPADVYFQTAQVRRDHRQAVLDRAYAANPGRFRRPPQAPPLPGPTGINTKTVNQTNQLSQTA